MNEERRENQNGSDEGGISIREIIGIIGKKFWLVLLGSVLAALAAVLIFMFALNPAKQSMSMSFRVDYPLSADRKYPDGSMFDYNDMISKKVVEAAMSSEKYKDEFASINVDKVMQDDAIMISARQTSTAADAPYVYTIILKSNYFKGVKTERFIKALTDAFVSEVISAKAAGLDYKLDKEVFEGASYKDQLSFLSEQKSTILNQYSDWISEYNEGYSVQGKSLSAHRTEVKTKLADKDKNAIEDNLTMKGYEYFNGEVNETQIKDRIKLLYSELELDKAILKELTNYNSGYTQANSIAPIDDTTTIPDSSGNTTVIVGGNSELMSYIKRVQTIEQQITSLIKGTNLESVDLDKTTAKDFATAVEALEEGALNGIVDEIKNFSGADKSNSLKSQFEGLEKSAETLTAVIREIYENNTLVTFESQRATSAGGTSILIVGVAVFVVAFLIFAVIAYFLGKKGGKAKKTVNAAPASDTPLENADDNEKSE